MGAEIAESAGIPLWNSLRAGRWRQASGLAKVALAFGSEAIATRRIQVPCNFLA